jgi:putative phosphoribosyl transferase
MIQLPFADRAEAGRLLAEELLMQNQPANLVVLALPRGGVPIGAEVAKAFGAPLDVVVVRKFGVPWQPELAMGAIAGDSFQTLDDEVIRALGILTEEIDDVAARASAEVTRREKLYRGDRAALDVHGRTILLVDDGLTTGPTMLVAARYVRHLKPRKIVIAVPVGSVQACRLLKKKADAIVCLATPEPFTAVGEWYVDFRQGTDAEVQRLLEQNRFQSALPELQTK